MIFPLNLSFPSNVQLIYCDLQILELAATFLCWKDQCRSDLEETLGSKIGTRVGVELHINNSISSLGLIIQNLAFHHEDPSEKLGEKFSIPESGSGSGYMIFITCLATIIGISIGLGLVGLAALKTRASHHPFYLGNTGDLQHITSSEDITIIQGNEGNNNKVA